VEQVPPLRYEELGVSLEAPAGSATEIPVPPLAGSARVVRLYWPEGPYSGLEIVITVRDALYETPIIAAGLYQRRRGINDQAFEAAAVPLTEERLVQLGAEDGVLLEFVVGGEEPLRVDALFAAVGGKLYRVEISRPIAPEGNIAEAVSLLESSFTILPKQDRNTPEGGVEAPPEKK
jgi:hypothetical protein